MENQFYHPASGGHAPEACFEVATASQWLRTAADTPDPVMLYGPLWFENEVACLFADTNAGKSILAVQIADHVARSGRRVLYFDFEMTAKQFQLRYTAANGRTLFAFHENFMRVELSQKAAPCATAEIIDAIRSVATSHDARVLIIDNITWLCNRCEEGDAAGSLMQALVELKRSYGLSILVLAHTPKRPAGTPLTQNCLAGSKRIANFLDSIFAIGRDYTEPIGNARYIKQIKVRSARETLGEGNVMRCIVGKEDNGNLRFDHIGYGRESDLLQARPTADAHREQLCRQAAELSARGMSLRQIARELGVSKSLVGNLLA